MYVFSLKSLELDYGMFVDFLNIGIYVTEKIHFLSSSTVSSEKKLRFKSISSAIEFVQIMSR